MHRSRWATPRSPALRWFTSWYDFQPPTAALIAEAFSRFAGRGSQSQDPPPAPSRPAQPLARPQRLPRRSPPPPPPPSLPPPLLARPPPRPRTPPAGPEARTTIRAAKRSAATAKRRTSQRP